MDRLNLDALVARVAQGDQQAYVSLLRESARIVRGYVYVRVAVQDRSAVEDIVQDTLLAIHVKYQSYDPSLPFLPWLRTVAHHKLVDHWRRQKIAFLVSIDEGDADLVVADIPQTDTVMTLERLFENLSDKQRKIIQMARLDGKTMAEIADEMSLSVSDVKVTLHRAIQKLSVFALRYRADGSGHAH